MLHFSYYSPLFLYCFIIDFSHTTLYYISRRYEKFDYDFDLVSGRYVIDAKSIMGIFSLDLSKPIDLNIHAEDSVDEVLEALKPYMI